MTLMTNKVITSETVQSTSRDKSSFKINEQWFKSFDPKKHGVDSLNPGDVVSFNFTEKTAPNGTIYRNVRSVVQVEGSDPTAVRASGPIPAPASRHTGPRGGFPIAPLDGQRAIIRQNCLGHATRIVCGTPIYIFDNEEPTKEDVIQTVIDIASRLEAYAAGDLDLEEAKKLAANSAASLPDIE